ncbi:MAG TPA: glutamate racemase [Balneolaceae bacterium]
MSDKKAPIGIFDSGIGGLTVVKAVREALPNENIVYFGDTARVPYGIKSEETVRGYALQITDFLMDRDVKMILIACNTVSASARNEILKAAGNIPVLDVITAGTHAAMQFPHHKKIGVIGTLATIGSKAYENAILKYNGGIEVISEACPLLVPLAEEGWTDNDIAKQVVHEYLQKFEGSDIDSLILGCTHYPLFKSTIKKTLHSSTIEIVDSALSIAEMAKDKLAKDKLLNDASSPEFNCFVSDRPQRFQELAERFLGTQVSNVHIAQLKG